MVHDRDCTWSSYARALVVDEADFEEVGDADPEPSPGATLRVGPTLTIPLSEITWRATTSGGPGGQHANRTLSRVEAQFVVESSSALGPRQRARLLSRYGPVVRAAAAESRSQARNRQAAFERLAEKLAEGLRVDPARRPTRPTKGSQVRRVEAKRRRSETKKGRRSPDEQDE